MKASPEFRIKKVETDSVCGTLYVQLTDCFGETMTVVNIDYGNEVPREEAEKAANKIASQLKKTFQIK